MRVCYIYVIKSSKSDWVYVGKTVNLRGRWKGHKSDARRDDPRHLYRAMRLHGIDTFEMTPIACTACSRIANEYEKLVISQFKEEGVRLYNHTAGGEGIVDLPTLETCQKISIRLKEVWSNVSKREKLGRSVKEALMNPEIKSKLGHKGSAHVRSKVTDLQVIAMREAYSKGTSTISLALQFNLGRRRVWSIVTGRSWKHLPFHHR